MFTDAEIAYFRSQRLGRLATVDGKGAPQNLPPEICAENTGFRCFPHRFRTFRRRGWYRIRDGKVAALRVFFDPRPLLH